MVIEKHILTGKGNLKEFFTDYEKFNNEGMESKTIKASNLFPIGEGGFKDREDPSQIYEYIIFYEENTAVLKEINKKSGQVQEKAVEAPKAIEPTPAAPTPQTPADAKAEATEKAVSTALSYD